MAAFLGQHLSPAPKPAELAERVRRAEGAIGQGLAHPGQGSTAREAAHRIIEAVLGGPLLRAERILKQGAFAARGEFTETLDALSETLADAGREASGYPPKDALPRGLAGRASVQALVQAAGKVTEAREAAQGNVNPQLLLAVMLEDLAEALCL